MKNTEIKGIIVPILTPMNEDESINEKELRNQVNRMIDAGVHGIFTFGTNGECYALSMDEKERVLAAVIKETAGRVPVYAGTGCVTTRETIELSRRAQKLGADVLSVITPYFAAASQDEIFEHYMLTASSVDLPVVLYNIPARTGNAIAPSTVRRLALASPNIRGAKDSSGNFDNMKKYMELTSDIDGFSVLSGNDSLILPALVFGGKGGIAGCANVFPHTMVGIYEAFAAGDLEKAKILQDSIRPLRDCFSYGNPNTVTKTAARLLGYPVGGCRRPFNSLSEEGMEKLKQVLKESVLAGLS